MPNKLLLPIIDDKLVIESSLKLLNDAGCERIVVVVPAFDYHVVHVLRSLRNWDVEFTKQQGEGVQAAIRSGIAEAVSQSAMIAVAFGDNVYADLYESE